MRHIFLFDIRAYANRAGFYIEGVVLLAFGIFAGHNFNLSIGEDVYLNSPYTIGFMGGMLSLAVIFIATLLAIQLLFKESDNRFEAIIYATPIQKRQLVWGRIAALVALSLMGVMLIISGFAFGQCLRAGREIQPGFRIFHYAYPLLVFSLVNGLFVCSVLCCVAWSSKNKLLVVVTGLLLYISYMVTLLFSNSPLMAQSLPQALEAQRVSALVDPFGLSAYIFSSGGYTVAQRNVSIVALDGYFLANRLAVSGVSLSLFAIAYRCFSFSGKKTRQRRSSISDNGVHVRQAHSAGLWVARIKENTLARLQAIGSFAKVDLIYLFKSIPLAVTVVALLFYTGMEMYAEIEKGIRFPQRYASAGLMAMTISGHFHGLGLFLMVYFVNDIFWTSNAERFLPIEKTTLFAGGKPFAHWLSTGVLLLLLTVLLVVEGVVFQLFYRYPQVNFEAYGGVWVFNTFPLMITAGILVLINSWVKNKYTALGLSFVFVLLTAGPTADQFLSFPLLRFQSGFSGMYSDFNGYGAYLPAFGYRLGFGICLVLSLWLLDSLLRKRKISRYAAFALILVFVAGTFSASRFMNGYVPQQGTERLVAAADYEKKYRRYQSIAQPTVTDVQTTIQLFPSKRSYTIAGTYVLKNHTHSTIDAILINFEEDFTIVNARFVTEAGRVPINQPVTEIRLPKPLLPNETASMVFEIAYKWEAVNGHQPFNAIVENGSFIRISRYFPQVGYQAQKEITDANERRQFRLGEATAPKRLDAPKTPGNDFINLDITISTEAHQTALGVGELVRHWKYDHRNYFQYKTIEPIPFRFAVSSAEYHVKSIVHRGRRINVFYNPKHEENVDYLIQNAQLTLDYCERYFGKYSFQSVNFAEVSSFTHGFAATAYTACIFMTEDLIFHANIQADRQQDVINELAGHELSHLWWGNNCVSPDYREGAAMLTESLAMYTEMMLYKKMHGKAKMLERLNMHLQIYESESGFTKEQPLYKVTDENTHIAYSKGAVVMYLLSELLGEETVNRALRNFLKKHRYPNPHPTSLDLLEEFYAVTPLDLHNKIDEWFKGITAINKDELYRLDSLAQTSLTDPFK